MSLNSDVSSPFINATGFVGTSDGITDLSAGTTYYCQVSASNSGGTSAFASGWDSVQRQDSYGIDGDVGRGNGVSLSWTSSSGAASYKVEVATSTGLRLL